MTMEFKCPQCGQMVEADESYAGQVAQCPHCGKGIVVPRGKPKAQVRRSVSTGVCNRESHSPFDVSGTSHVVTQDDSMATLPSFTEKQCFKAFAWYWVARLLVAIVFSLLISLFIWSTNYYIQHHGHGFWPFVGHAYFIDFSQRIFYIVGTVIFHVVVLFCVWLLWWGSWKCYKIFVVRGLFGQEQVAKNVFSSWLLPGLITSVIFLLIPGNVLILVLGLYGYIVWCLTIWVLLDYCLFRFISVEMLRGRRIALNPSWICAALMFCMLIAMVFGFGHLREDLKSIKHDLAEKVAPPSRFNNEAISVIIEGTRHINGEVYLPSSK